MRAQTCITCEFFNAHTTQPAHPCVLDNGTVRCSSYRPSSAYIEGVLEGKVDALLDAKTLLVRRAWATRSNDVKLCAQIVAQMIDPNVSAAALGREIEEVGK